MNDLSKFRLVNVADTCSIWNLLASRLLHAAARRERVTVCCTQFVRYECLHKPGQPKPERTQLQQRLRRELDSGQIMSCNIELEDLQDLQVLEQRKNVSKGELSSIVFAKRTGHAFMTDDLKAAKLAATIIPGDHIQSTPHLLGWLYFRGQLQDSDKDKIVGELQAFGRHLQPHLDRSYEEALRCRLMAAQSVASRVNPQNPGAPLEAEEPSPARKGGAAGVDDKSPGGATG